MGKIGVQGGGCGASAGQAGEQGVLRLSGLARGCALSLRSPRAPVRKGRLASSGAPGQRRRPGPVCACACELRRAGFCLSHNVTLEEEAGRASCTFLPPLVSSSPPAPASSGSALRRHLHNKSPQVLGGERAGRAPVTRAPR